MVLYRLIGQDTTNSSGVASVNYTGTGKGLTQIVASTDDPSHISEGSLQSEIYATWDCLFYDDAIQGTSNDNWTSLNKMTRGSDGTLFNGNAYNNTRIMVNNSADLPLIECAVEVTVFDVTDGCRLYCTSNTGSSIPISNGNWKLELKYDGNIYIYKDGTLQGTRTYNTGLSTHSIGFQIITDTSSLKFKDFKYYPI